MRIVTRGASPQRSRSPQRTWKRKRKRRKISRDKVGDASGEIQAEGGA